MPKLPSYVCDLDGRRVRFSLKKRPDSRYYFAVFRDPATRRTELTTGETNKERAQVSALAVIRNLYTPPPLQNHPSWDDAGAIMLEQMKAEGLRPGTIQQYELAVSAVRKVFPYTDGPADITPAMAERFKVVRSGHVSARTVESNIKNLSIVYNWLSHRCKILDGNPFADVTPPRYDEQPPRIVSANEKAEFFTWLKDRWGWRLPLLFLEVKAAIGCRIGELCSASTDSLSKGRICFTSETTKGRRQRACLLPPELFKELLALAGPCYLFERFSDELREIHRKRGRNNHAQAVRGFTPARLKRWLQDETKTYTRTKGGEPFKLHSFRATAMTKARMAGVPVDDAAIAFGCNPGTMRQYYLNPDEEEIADGVFKRMRGG